jgi:hypothetical protein
LESSARMRRPAAALYTYALFFVCERASDSGREKDEGVVASVAFHVFSLSFYARAGVSLLYGRVRWLLFVKSRPCARAHEHGLAHWPGTWIGEGWRGTAARGIHKETE